MIQANLFEVQVNPTLHGTNHYVPVLRTMFGELQALRHLDESTRQWVTPLVEVAARSSDDGEPPASSPIPNLAFRLADSLGKQAPFFLDFPWLKSSTTVLVGSTGHRTKARAIDHVLNECSRLGLQYVPVLAPTKDAGKASLVRDAASDGRGAAIRLPITGVAWTEEIAETLDRFLEDLGTSPEATDLLVDMRYIPQEPRFEPRHVARWIGGLPDIQRWRSLVLTGTVIPATLSGFPEGAVSELLRHEWRFWNELRQLGVARMPSYGDYAVQHPDRTGGGPGMRANIRYTTPERVLLARGHSITEFGSDQYRDLCGLLVQRSEFRGSHFSWGDECIEACAAGRLEPGNQQRWRGAGTSHHLGLVVDELRQVAA